MESSSLVDPGTSAVWRGLAASRLTTWLLRGLVAVWLLVACAALGAVAITVRIRHLADAAIATLHAAARRASTEGVTPTATYAATARTGDILIMQCGSHGLTELPTVEMYPTHSAFVWVRPSGGVFVVEATKFCAPYLPNVLPATQGYTRGVRVVPLDAFLHAHEDCWTYVAVRRRAADAMALDDAAVEALACSWFPTLDFEPLIADRMDTHTFLVTAVGELVPWVSTWAGVAGGLAHTAPRAHSVYCSEFVTLLLARLGVVSLAPLQDAAWRVAPASLLHGRTLDKLAAPGHAWQAEEMLVLADGVGDVTLRPGDLWGQLAVLRGLTRKAAHL